MVVRYSCGARVCVWHVRREAGLSRSPLALLLLVQHRFYDDSDRSGGGSHAWFWVLEVMAWMMLLIGLVSLVSYAYRKRMAYEQLPGGYAYNQYGQPIGGEGVYYGSYTGAGGSSGGGGTTTSATSLRSQPNLAMPALPNMMPGGYQNFQPTAYYHPYYSSYAHPAYYPSQVVPGATTQYTSRPPNIANVYAPAPYSVGGSLANPTTSTMNAASASSTGSSTTTATAAARS